jgi:hypothetical protein
MTSFPRAMTLVLALTLTLSALGCAAKDRHVFVSTVNQPTTIVLVDTYTSEAVWEMDIPVNHKLSLDFDGTTAGQSSDGVSPRWVIWELYRADDLPTDTGKARKGTLIQNDRVDLTGMKILMQTSYRPGPEIPGSMDAAPIPVQETAQSVAAEAIAESKAAADTVEVTEDADAEAEVPAEEAVVEAAEESTEAVQEVSVDEVADVVEEAAEESATQPTK